MITRLQTPQLPICLSNPYFAATGVELWYLYIQLSFNILILYLFPKILFEFATGPGVLELNFDISTATKISAQVAKCTLPLSVEQACAYETLKSVFLIMINLLYTTKWKTTATKNQKKHPAKKGSTIQGKITRQTKPRLKGSTGNWAAHWPDHQK